MNPAYTAARDISNSLGQGYRESKDSNMIETILEQASSTGDPAVLQNSISKILSQVSPERQSGALQHLQNAYANVQKKQAEQKAEVTGRAAAQDSGYTYGAPPAVQAQQVRDKAKGQRLSQYGLGEQPNQPNVSPQSAPPQPGEQPSPNANPQQITSAFRKLSDDQLVLAAGAPDREVSEPAKLELKRRSDEKELAQKKEDRKLKFGQDIGKKVLERADEVAESLPLKQSALNLMNDAIVNKNLEFFSRDHLAEITGFEGLRSKEGAIFKTAGKEYFLGSISRAGARPNQWIEQQIADMMTKVGRSTEANLSVSRAMQNELDLQKEQVRLTAEVADEIEAGDGNYRKLGSILNSRLAKYAEDKQNELFNDLRAIAAISEDKPQHFHKVVPGTALSDYIIDGLLINFNNDPVKAIQEAKKLGYKVE